MWRFKKRFRKRGIRNDEMDNKNNLVSNQLAAEYPYCLLTFILGIGTTILYFLMLMCIVAAIGSFMQKDISLGIEALVLGFC